MAALSEAKLPHRQAQREYCQGLAKQGLDSDVASLSQCFIWETQIPVHLDKNKLLQSLLQHMQNLLGSVCHSEFQVRIYKWHADMLRLVTCKGPNMDDPNITRRFRYMTVVATKFTSRLLESVLSAVPSHQTNFAKTDVYIIIHHYIHYTYNHI